MSDILDHEEIRSRILAISDDVDKSMQQHLKDDQLGNIVNILMYDQHHPGKRLRPALASFVSETLGGNYQETIDIATACELLHSASLMLDDIIDDDKTRRGNPAAHTVFGSGMTLMGTYIYALVGIELGIVRSQELGKLLVNVIRRLVIGSAEEFTWTDWDETSYMRIIGNKTASLFEAPCEIGVIVSGALQHRDLARRYGNALGMMYQLCDDYVDIAKSIRLSEPIGDIKERVTTLPILHCYTATGKPEIRMLLDLYRKKTELPDSHLRLILYEMEACKSLEFLLDAINKYRATAESLASLFPIYNRLSISGAHPRDYLVAMPGFLFNAQMDEIEMPDLTGP